MGGFDALKDLMVADQEDPEPFPYILDAFNIIHWCNVVLKDEIKDKLFNHVR